MNHTGDKHSPSAWKMTNAMESWSRSGCEGADAKVEVYTRADHVCLFLNGKCVGEKKRKNDCRVIFHIKYQNGELKAVAYDERNRAVAEKVLKSAGQETVLLLEPEQKVVKRDTELCYIRLKYTDEEGVLKPLVRGDIKVIVEGGTLLGLGSACPYYTKGYLTDTADTYYGEALAIVRPDGAKKIVVKAQSKYGDAAGEVIIGGGLGYFLSYELGTFLAQCINFPLQRNITFKSHGKISWQIMWYFIYFKKVLHFESGLPLTTKKNKRDHGFGLKSIRYTAEKYNGTITVQTENQIFMLQVLIPII